MTNLVKKAVLGGVLGATVLTGMAPVAEAQRYRHYHRDRDNGGAALVAGIAGLAIGAALASDRGYDRRYDYDRRFYRTRGYYPVDGYYYRDHYRRYRGWERCGVRRMYDPYLGHPVRVRYCR
ncbi:hypothetical protein LQ953_10880 [Sphingomonas sp. IC-56]|uniref:hypothetical protein n=1 Tax=Sphingomonas sp. IC-56 TaxID=2898529 RepID=UPI001E399285|nr:hypothetical protein [Sphingomonas sp. IC-56]MCD2324518.1 hypothetical protein [Sphingomonas sp. IC-56]